MLNKSQIQWATGTLFNEYGLCLYRGHQGLDPSLAPQIDQFKRQMAQASRNRHPFIAISDKEGAIGILYALLCIEAGLPFLFLSENDLTTAPDLYPLASSLQAQHGAVSFYIKTSGTSGRPKLVARTLQSWLLSFEAHRRAFSLDPTNNWLIPGSTVFSANLYNALLGLYLGKCLYIQTTLSPKQFLFYLSQYHIDTLLTVPSIVGLLNQLCKSSGHPLNLLRLITVGEVLPPQVCTTTLEHLKNPKAQAYHYYGAAELGQVAYTNYFDLSKEPRLLGKAFAGVNLNIDLDHNILVTSDYLALGYTPPATVYDKGYIQEGQLFFRGRTDLQFNIHGKKINLETMVHALLDLPTIMAVYVERLPGEAYQLHLLTSTSTPVLQPIRDAIKGYTIPKGIHLYTQDQMHYNASGKLDWIATLANNVK